MNRTAQQTAFIDALLNTDQNIALVARAGTGKTTTILEGVSDYAARNPAHEIAIVAFGKGIQREIEGKLKARGLDDWRRYSAVTSHSLGFSLVKFVFKLGRDNIDDNKVRDLIRAQNTPIYSAYGAQIQQLVHLAKTEGFGFFGDIQIGDNAAWYKMADHYDVNGFDDTSDMDAVIEAAQNIYRLSLAKVDIIDFDDMILFPLVKNLRVKFGKDLIVVDEAQDTSRARRALIRKFLKPDGRMVVVGDDRQAIMGFSGSSADALQEFIDDLQAVSLPLNVTWRCPKAVVKEAQRIVPDIIAAPSAPEGSVIHASEFPAKLLPTDAILCRNTAPLIKQAYTMIRNGVACKVEGREIGSGLLRVVDRWKVATITAFLDKLEDYRARECQKAVAKGKEAKVEEINDRCDTLVIVCQAVQDKKGTSLDDVRAFINNLFADDVTASGVVCLCTYHRSKGREWPRVMLINHGMLCPSPRAKQAWQLRQEHNAMYVALTRAQETLIHVDMAG